MPNSRCSTVLLSSHHSAANAASKGCARGLVGTSPSPHGTKFLQSINFKRSSSRSINLALSLEDDEDDLSQNSIHNINDSGHLNMGDENSSNRSSSYGSSSNGSTSSGSSSSRSSYDGSYSNSRSSNAPSGGELNEDGLKESNEASVASKGGF